jgi:5-methylthioadenosine/S-adenosylhomocysteine deaminase
MAMDLVIRDVTVVDPGAAIRILPSHDVAIAGNRIASVVPTGGAASDAARVIDGGGMVLLPGLVNTHAHAAMVLFRGAAEDVTVESWFNDIIWPMESALTPDDVYWGTLLAAAEMIESGVTTVADHYLFADRAAEAVAASGMRGHLAWTMFGHDGAAELDRSARFAADWHRGAGGRIRVWLGPHSPYLCPPEFLRAVAGEAARCGLGSHIHVAETAQQVALCRAQHGVSPFRLLQQTGLMDQALLCAHAAHPDGDDLALLAAHPAGVAHCPKTFLKLAAGIAPVSRMRELSIPVGLGSDGAGSNNTLDIFEQMRLAAMLQKHQTGDPRALTVHDALALATTGGAAVLGQSTDLGRVADGYLADLILVRTDGAHVQPVHDVAAALVYSVRASDVETVIVDGVILMEGRRLLTIDKRAVLREAAQRVARLTRRRPERRLQTYPGATDN